MSRQTIITNGTVIHAERQEKADVVLEGSKIASVGKGLAKTAAPDAEVIDAAGKYVIPGALDVHVHLELPFCGTFQRRLEHRHSCGRSRRRDDRHRLRHSL